MFFICDFPPKNVNVLNTHIYIQMCVCGKGSLHMNIV